MATSISDQEASIFSQKHSRLPDDTVFFAIFPDSFVSSSVTDISSSLQSIHLQILQTLSPYTSSYIWQHEPFSLSLSTSASCICSSSHTPSHPPHLHGKLRFGDNLEDEWFVVFLLFEISRRCEHLSIRAWDNDGEFLLIEAAFHLPRWINPENSQNRVFIRRGDLHIIPRKRLSSPNLVDALKFLIDREDDSRAADEVQQAVKSRIAEYPERARRNMHQVRVRVPASVAQVLKHEPCLISLAVEAFYDRDIDTMKYAGKMERLLSRGREEELVCLAVRMPRAMYAQLVQQNFQAPKCYPMPIRSEDKSVYMEAELGMKIACGFEMIYQQKRREGEEGKGSTWQKYKEFLETSGYFEGLLPGSKEHRRLMENAEEYYRKSSAFSRTSEMLSAPVRRINEILGFLYSAEDFRGREVPPSDDDDWLYRGEDELNSALQERQKEMELYNSKHTKKQQLKKPRDSGPSSSSNYDDFGLDEIAKTMQKFVDKVSSYKGAEVPAERNMEAVNLDVDRFFKDMELATKHHEQEDSDDDVHEEEGSSPDMDFDESEDGSDNEDGEETFMDTYSDALNKELKNTTLEKSFVRSGDHSLLKNEGKTATEEMDEDFTPVDVDVNLVKSLLDSFSYQQGQPGPASNLLGLMGVQLPQDDNKSK